MSCIQQYTAVHVIQTHSAIFYPLADNAGSA